MFQFLFPFPEQIFRNTFNIIDSCTDVTGLGGTTFILAVETIVNFFKITTIDIDSGAELLKCRGELFTGRILCIAGFFYTVYEDVTLLTPKLSIVL